MQGSPQFSVVVPVYKCAPCLQELQRRLKEVFNKLNTSYELILVNDGCPEGSWEVIEKLIEQDINITGIDLSRNFGQHIAISAGLDKAQGSWIVIMDGDLQDQPEEIPKLYNQAMKGFDIVFAQREKRKDPLLKRMLSYLFYKVLGFLSSTSQDASTANFGIYSATVIQSVRLLREKMRFFPLMVRWVGFKSSAISVDHAERKEGKSAYTFGKLMNIALDTLIAFSDKPLKLMILFGLGVSFSSFIFAAYIFLRASLGYVQAIGWSSLIVSLWFFSGIIMLLLGFVGIYIGRIFTEVKDRPLYIVRKLISQGTRQ